MRLRKQKENQAYQRLEEELGKAEINEDKLQDALEIIQNLQEKSQIRRNITIEYDQQLKEEKFVQIQEQQEK